MSKKFLGVCSLVLAVLGGSKSEAMRELPQGEVQMEANIKATIEADFSGLAMGKIDLYDDQGIAQDVERKVSVAVLNSNAFKVAFTGSDGLSLETGRGGKFWQMKASCGATIPVEIQMKPQGESEYVNITESSVNFKQNWGAGEWVFLFRSIADNAAKAAQYTGKIKIAIESVR